jgi:GMP synthase-like glutamine amidotransferase
MKTRSLIVDCSLGPSRNGALFEAVKKLSRCTVIQFRNIYAGYRVAGDIDAVVISGSAARIVEPSHRDMFAGTVNLIKKLNLPVLSICFGHQLLCWTLGARVASLAEPVNDRFEEVHILEADEIFAGFEERQTIPLAQSHYDYVLKESLDQAGLVLLADSPSCEVEAIKHKHNPLYGVQFHPERIKMKGKSHTEGHKIIHNFYKNVVKR